MMRKNNFKKYIMLLLAMTTLTTLSSCTFEDYVKYIFNMEERVSHNSIKFLEDTYYVTKSDIEKGVKAFLQIQLEDSSYLSDITFRLADNDRYNATITDDGTIIPNANLFVEGTTTLRARIEPLGLEAIATVVFLNVSTQIDYVTVDSSKNNSIIIERQSTLSLVSRYDINNENYEIEFLDSYAQVLEVNSNGFVIESSVLGKIDYIVRIKANNQIVFKGQLYSHLSNQAIEERVRTILDKGEEDIISIQELNDIDNLDDGVCFVNAEINNMDDFKYFPLTTYLNLSRNNIREVELNLPQLKSLNLSYCQISKITFPNDNYDLEELNLSYCNYDISKFEDYKLSNLRILYLTNNYSSTNNLKLNGNSKFVYLNVNDNNLNSISVDNKAALNYILAAGNNLTDLSEFASAPLKVIDVANNRISSLDFLEDNKELTEIYLGGNPLSTTELSYIAKDVRKNITRLNLSITGNINMDVLKQFVLDCSESLTWLQLYGIGLTDISWINYISMPNLKYIKVTHNNISDFSSLDYISTVVKDNTDMRQDDY